MTKPKTIPLPSPSDWVAGCALGEKCCLLGWAIRAFGGTANDGWFSEYLKPTKTALKFAREVAQEALGGSVENFEDAITSAFDDNRRLDWSAAWAKVARRWGYTRRCKVKRPAPL